VREHERRLDVRRQLAEQPMPKPSPFVVSAPSLEWRLWSIRECFGL
jgi:hypothetical protein